MQHEKKGTREMAANLEATCGPAARYADHQVGEQITYRVGEVIRSGQIVFVQAAAQVGSGHTPLTYVTDANMGFPDLVWQSDIIESPLA